MDGSGRSSKVTYTPAEEEEFRKLANSPDCHERIMKSIAPSIYGSEDIKKSIACLLFAGNIQFLSSTMLMNICCKLTLRVDCAILA